MFWWALQDSNLYSTDYESAALTIKLKAHTCIIWSFSRFVLIVLVLSYHFVEFVVVVASTIL